MVSVLDQASIDASFLASGSPGNPYPGQAGAQGYTGVIGVGSGSSIVYNTFRNGVLVGSQAGSGNTDTVALAAGYGIGGAQVNTIGGLAGTGAQINGGYAAGVSGVSPVGPTTGGINVPGGSAGSLGINTASGLLNQLSHTTAGLNWTHLALWLAILAGAYIALETLTGGKRRRR